MVEKTVFPVWLVWKLDAVLSFFSLLLVMKYSDESNLGEKGVHSGLGLIGTAHLQWESQDKRSRRLQLEKREWR